MCDRLRGQLAHIRQNIEEAREKGGPLWPLNEADTERLAVEPVLKALGYQELD